MLALSIVRAMKCRQSQGIALNSVRADTNTHLVKTPPFTTRIHEGSCSIDTFMLVAEKVSKVDQPLD